MATFTPLNIIPDSDSEGEIDNTEEIQIEAALKLYHQALRLHTDGAWEEAHKAYDDLFRSEIFQLDVEEQVHGRNSNIASSLPLVHYLSFKNHGAFKLDRLKASLSTTNEHDVQSAVAQALEWFVTALDRDAGDSALWRQSAQLALVLCSARLARFALESVLDHETVGADASKDALSLVAGGNQNPEDFFASLQLQKILERICDFVSMPKGISRKTMIKKFAKFLNPVPWLPEPTLEDMKPLSVMIEQFSERRQVVTVTSRTWPAVGKALLELLPDGDEELDAISQFNTLQLLLPLYEGEQESRDTTPDQPSPQESGSKSENAAVDENEDVTMTDASTTLAANSNDRRRSGSANRKRKSTSMGVDGADSGRSRLSKRQRDKKAADAAAAEAAASTPESRAKIRQDTQDEKLFNTAYDCFSPFGLSLGNASILKINNSIDAMDISDDSGSKSEKCDLYLEDFKTILQTWDDDKGNVILYGDGIQSPAEAAQGMSFLDLEANIPSRPLLSGDDGLRKWARNINAKGLCASQAALEWLKALCKKDVDPRNKSKSPTISSGMSSWMKHNWPDFLKATVLTIANKCETTCFQFFKDVEEDLNKRSSDDKAYKFTQNDYANVEFAETMLELYLDDLAAAERDRSGGDINNGPESDLGVKREKVLRWTYLVGDMMHRRPRDSAGQLDEDQLTLRYLWTTAVIAGFTGNSTREFRLACFEDLKDLLAERGPPIDLPNSGVMPEISAARAEREISKLKTVDFFSTIFAATSDTDEKDPTEVVEILEAVLEPDAILPYDEEEERILHEIGRFLRGSSAMFRLHLWEKLRTAYENVNYPPKVLSCTLKSIQVVMGELKSRSYVDSSEDHRQFVLLRSLRLVKGMMTDALALSKNEQNISELSEQELLDALSSTLEMLRILHCYAFWESAVLKSEVKASDLHSYRLVVMKFKELLVQGWIVAYLLYSAMLKRGMGAEKCDGLEEEREKRLAGLLRDLHEELGARHYCKLANHLLLKLMFDELLKFNNREYDSDLLQVIHCRFHLTLCSDQWYFFEHKTVPEPLERATALRLIDFIMYQSSKKKILQLTKSDLKTGLDKLVEILGVPRPGNTRVAHNIAVIDSYLKSTIHPLRLFGCLRGDLDISTVEIFGEWKEIATKGLYFLQGKIALYPLRYTKRVGTLKGDELEVAIQFFKHDVVCNPNSWETWYRVGQTFEVQMEEAQTWSSEYLNMKRQDLVQLERRTILSYMMAVSLAARHSTDSQEVRKTISELYTDFGYRIYSAARPPMASESFWTDGHERHFSGRNGQGMYTKRPHAELNLQTALRYALKLFHKALVDSEDNWKNHYMIGKCLAKLQKIQEHPPERILQHFVDAIKHCPEKGNEIIFEPHHKLISTASKFVLDKSLDPKHACKILDASRFTKGIDHADDQASFVIYALEVLKKMKSADKQKWHHRMTNRMARLRYSELNDTAGARLEFSSLFSNKAAQLSIWRPEFERPGRHFVFASQYTMFYVELLEQLGDRATLETLAKRVRRLPHGLYRHNDIWSFVFDKYISVLRRTGGVGAASTLEDEVFKNVSFDEFTTYSQRLDAYCNNLKDSQCLTLDLLREVFELRRLNGGLARNPNIDDLLADTYAKLWQELVPGIVEQENEKQLNPMSLKNMMFDAPSAPLSIVPTISTSEGPSGVKMDLELPLRAKMTRVTRRELISKATNLCKEMNQAPSITTSSPLKPGSTAPSSPKIKNVELGDDSIRDEAMTSDVHHDTPIDFSAPPNSITEE